MKGKQSRFAAYFCHQVNRDWLAKQLFMVTISTGLLDATSYGAFYVFSSNQTGNVIILLSLALGLHSRYAPPTGGPSILTTGISLASFLTFAFISGRIGMKYGHRQRWWLLLSTSIQCILLLITAILTQVGILSIHFESVRPREPELDAIPMALLASAAGLQVSQARTSGVQEIPTAMLTSPMTDFVVHPNLLTLQFRSNGDPGIRSRNMRAIYILCLVFGIVIGAAIQNRKGAAAAIFTAFAIRFTGFIFLMLMPKENKSDVIEQR